MREGLENTVERFCKKEILPRAEMLHTREPAKETVQNVISMMKETGLSTLFLPQSLGGAGFETVQACEVLKKISEFSAGVASLLLFHYGGLLPIMIGVEEKKIPQRLPDLSAAWITGLYHFSQGMAGGIWNLPYSDFVVIYEEKSSAISIIPVEEIKFWKPQPSLGLQPSILCKVELPNLQREGFHAFTFQDEDSIWKIRGVINLFIASVALGNAEGAFQHAIRYASERYQGGDILINHTIIQTMLGRMRAKLDACEAMVRKGMEEWIKNKRDLLKTISVKAFVTETCEQVCSDAVQIFGGYGYMKEFHVERHLRDSKTLCVIGGGNDFLLQEYTRKLGRSS